MRLGLMVTQQCNYACRHCMVDSVQTHSIVSDKVFERFMEIAKYTNPDQICLVGGEPFLHLDKVEWMVGRMKSVCSNILVYSNGTFLKDGVASQRIEALGVRVRISRTEFHRDFWTDDILERINASPYIKTDGLTADLSIFPRGRALTNGVYKDQTCPCSLVMQEYEGYLWSHRFLVMMDGSVNLWCPCMALELANIFDDEMITHDLLVRRERQLHNYLVSVNMMYDSMHFMCNEECSRFRVKKSGIYRDEELMEEF